MARLCQAVWSMSEDQSDQSPTIKLKTWSQQRIDPALLHAVYQELFTSWQHSYTSLSSSVVSWHLPYWLLEHFIVPSRSLTSAAWYPWSVMSHHRNDRSYCVRLDSWGRCEWIVEYRHQPNKCLIASHPVRLPKHLLEDDLCLQHILSIIASYLIQLPGCSQEDGNIFQYIYCIL